MQLVTRNTNTAMPMVFGELFADSRQYMKETSRNGTVCSIPHPVTITYTHPLERVNFCPVRDANPFFHLLETVWMFAGRDDVAYPSSIVENMKNYSNDGVVLDGAYGHRLRLNTPASGLDSVVQMLKENPDTRRAYVPIYKRLDVNRDSNDIPCNVGIGFRLIRSRLDMHVFNRSNDAVWGGVCGSNVVHFSYFLEYVARRVSAIPGRMHVTSSNLHVYINEQSSKILDHYSSTTHASDLYMQGARVRELTSHEVTTLENACGLYLQDTYVDNEWIRDIVNPMACALKLWKAGERRRAYEYLIVELGNCDWQVAALNWMYRRLNK